MDIIINVTVGQPIGRLTKAYLQYLEREQEKHVQECEASIQRSEQQAKETLRMMNALKNI